MVLPKTHDTFVLTTPLSFSDDEASDSEGLNAFSFFSGGAGGCDDREEKQQQQQLLLKHEQKQQPWECVELVKGFASERNPMKTRKKLAQVKQLSGCAVAELVRETPASQGQRNQRQTGNGRRSRSRSKARQTRASLKSRAPSKGRDQRNRGAYTTTKGKYDMSEIKGQKSFYMQPILVPARSPRAHGAYGPCSFNVHDQMDLESPPNGLGLAVNRARGPSFMTQNTTSEGSSMNLVTSSNKETQERESPGFIFRFSSNGGADFQSLTQSFWGLEFKEAYSCDGDEKEPIEENVEDERDEKEPKDENVEDESNLDDDILLPLVEKSKHFRRLGDGAKNPAALKIYTPSKTMVREESRQKPRRTKPKSQGAHKTRKPPQQTSNSTAMKAEKSKNSESANRRESEDPKTIRKLQHANEYAKTHLVTAAKDAPKNEENTTSVKSQPDTKSSKGAKIRDTKTGAFAWAATSPEARQGFMNAFPASVFRSVVASRNQGNANNSKNNQESISPTLKSTEPRKVTFARERPVLLKEDAENGAVEALGDLEAVSTMFPASNGPATSSTLDGKWGEDESTEASTLYTTSSGSSLSIEDRSSDGPNPIAHFERAVVGMDMDALFDTMEVDDEDEEESQVALCSVDYDETMEFMMLADLCASSSMDSTAVCTTLMDCKDMTLLSVDSAITSASACTSTLFDTTDETIASQQSFDRHYPDCASV
ncbi:hypothetical protein ACA910_021431 [Epithemia clementina (nom. ined.)]